MQAITTIGLDIANVHPLSRLVNFDNRVPVAAMRSVRLGDVTSRGLRPLLAFIAIGSLTRTVRHRSPMRARARCACTRLAAADLKRVTFAGSSLGNALPPLVTASLI